MDAGCEQMVIAWMQGTFHMISCYMNVDRPKILALTPGRLDG